MTNHADPSALHPSQRPRALDVIAGLNKQELSATELLQDTYEHIAEHNNDLNAICTLRPFEEALVDAREVDARRGRGEVMPPLAGLPMAIKDLASTKGLLTTMGSPILKDNVPDTDSLFVSRLRAAGAVIIGKTNTPEFGAGSHTFNPVFGTTRNPYDCRRIAGGSSGGAAVALASGMLALADGSDMGGSLRNPAAYNNVVGLRPSMGRVPSWPLLSSRFARMAVEGPMARTVEDCALLLSVMAGPDQRDPRSSAWPVDDFTASLETDVSQYRLGWAPRPMGIPVEADVSKVLSRAAQRMWQLCPSTEEIDLNELVGAMDVFEIIRAAAFAMLMGDLYRTHSGDMKPTLRDNIAQGIHLSVDEIYRAEHLRSTLFEKLLGLFERFDYLLLPVTQVMPFPVEVEYPEVIEGKPMANYIEWMSSCCMLSPFDVPCLSVPAGFNEEGLPVGLQIVGRPGDDLGVLRLGYAFQQATEYWRRSPLQTGD